LDDVLEARKVSQGIVEQTSTRKASGYFGNDQGRKNSMADCFVCRPVGDR
jgi:hypothetical protein